MIQTFFGDKAHAYSLTNGKSISAQEYFKDPQLSFLQEHMGLTSLIVLKQTHSADGFIFSSKNVLARHCERPQGDVAIQENLDIPPLRTHEGDFIITNQKNVGIAVLTADCLPIIFYDQHKKVIAIAHAGWRGSVKKIAQNVIQEMEVRFATNVKNIQVWFGPAAQVCCYEVSENFYKEAADDEQFQNSIIKKGKNFFFDNGEYNKKQLLEMGILESALCFDAYLCTLCTPRFCSYRKDQGAQTRNVTVVSLK